MSEEYAPAEWIGTNHFWAGRSGYTPRWIIVHGTAGGVSAEDVASFFQGNDPPTSTHYVIGRDGEVVQCVSEDDTAWGNGIVTEGHDPWWSPNLNPNFLTFSIEHVKPSPDNSDALTPAQKAASFALIAHLCQTYNIPIRRADASGGIAPHASIDPVNRGFCPGPYPWDDLIAYLNGNTTPGAPTGWRDDGHNLIAPNGQRVVLGFRWYILNHPWEPDNWPLEREHYAEQLDVTNPSLGAGTIQHFRRAILGWNEQSGDLYELWSGAIALRWETLAEAHNQTAPQPTPQQPAPAQLSPAHETLAAAGDAMATMGMAGAAGVAGIAGTEVVARANANNGAGARQAMRAPATHPTQNGQPVGDANSAREPVAVGAVRFPASMRSAAKSASGPQRAVHPAVDPAHALATPAVALAVAANVAALVGASDSSQVSGAGQGKPPAAYGASAPASRANTANAPDAAHAATIANTGDAAGAALNTLANDAQALTGDPLGARLASLERQIQALTQGVSQALNQTPQGRTLARDAGQAVATIEHELTNPKARKGLFSNPRTLIRWILMIIGLLFSDALAWAITTFAQHPGALPIPFLTIGTVFSGAFFLIAARMRI